MLVSFSAFGQYEGYHIINNTASLVRWRLYTASTAAQNPASDTVVNEFVIGANTRMDVWNSTAYEGKYAYVMCTNGAGAYIIPAFPLASQYMPTNNQSGYTYKDFYVRGDPTNCIYAWKGVTLYNDTAQDAIGVWEIDGAEQVRHTLTPGMYKAVGFQVELCPSHEEVVTAYLLKKLFDFDLTDHDNDPLTVPKITPVEKITQGPPLVGSDTNTPTTGGGGVGAFNPTNVVWRNYTNVIDFTGTSATAAKDDTLKAGFGRLSDQLREVKESIDLNTVATLQGSGSSSTNGSGDMSGVEDAIDEFHRDNTNLLAGILGALTNASMAVGDMSTNGAAALTEATTRMSDATAAADDALTALGSAPTEIGSPSASVFTFTFVGQEMNIDPENLFPGMGAFFRAGMMLVVGMWLGRYLSELYRNTATTFATAQTGGVPSVGPFGSVGLIMGAAVAVAVIVLWVAVFTYFFSFVTSLFGEIAGAVAGFNVGDSGAAYLINYFFPVAFIMACAWTRLIAPIAVTKLVILTSAAQKLLLGK